MAMPTVGAPSFVAGVALITIAGALDLGTLFVPGIVLALAVALRGPAAVAPGEAGVATSYPYDKRARALSVLLVVLCGDRSTRPVVNTGSLHH